MSTAQSYEESELISSIAGGNEEAFAVFFYRYGALLHPVILRVVKNKSVAEDVISDVFLKIWINRAKLPEVDNIRAYLNRMAINVSINYLRKDRLQEAVLKKIFTDLPTSDNEAESRITANELKQVIDQAVQILPVQQKKVFELSRKDGLDRKAIAELLGLSENTVKNHLRLALHHVQEFIHQRYGLQICLILLLRKIYG